MQSPVGTAGSFLGVLNPFCPAPTLRPLEGTALWMHHVIYRAGLFDSDRVRKMMG